MGENHSYSSAPTRRHTKVALWLVVALLALGVFLVGMLGTGVALASSITDTGHIQPTSDLDAHQG